MVGKTHWRCFHCDETFTKAQERWAREHFGRDESKDPVCLIRTAGESSLLTALRNAQDELDLNRANTDDSDVVRAMGAMAADHAQALIREEERGYAKGVSDMRDENAALQSDLSSARERIATLEAALKWYADQFCERSRHYEGCGKLDDDECSGCRARSALGDQK